MKSFGMFDMREVVMHTHDRKQMKNKSPPIGD